jgi:5-dehydro-4-deoxyglucarate dehydratase
MSTELTLPLRGVIGFPVTPFSADLRVDHAALQDLIEWMSGYPFAALVAAGGAGEFFSLAAEEVDEVVGTTVEAADGAVPVIGTVGASVAEAVRAARRAAERGASALLVLPPYYTNPPEDGLLAYYETVAAATDLPVGIYSRDWAVFTPEAVARLVERIPNLAFWKDGQGDIRRLHRMMGAVGVRLSWTGGVGDDCAPGYFALGIKAYSSSFASILPELSFAIADAGIAGKLDRVRMLMERYVHPFFDFRERRRGYEVAAIKEAMRLLGRDVGTVRPPLTPITPDDQPALEAAVEVLQRFGEDMEPSQLGVSDPSVADVVADDL